SVWTADGWPYVAAGMASYSTGIIGWSMQASMTSQFVTDALMMALLRRGRQRAVLHQSDQGSQYTSEQFQMLLADAGIICSMSKRGDCWDIREARLLHAVELLNEKILLLTSSLLRGITIRSEEHTSELQSRENLVCRLLL